MFFELQSKQEMENLIVDSFVSVEQRNYETKRKRL